MASPRTLKFYRATKRKPTTISMGSLGFVCYWGAPQPSEPVSIRRSEYRRYLRDGQVSAIIPVHLTDIQSEREFDLRTKV